jgi:hypothetical protein
LVPRSGDSDIALNVSVGRPITHKVPSKAIRRFRGFAQIPEFTTMARRTPGATKKKEKKTEVRSQKTERRTILAAGSSGDLCACSAGLFAFSPSRLPSSLLLTSDFSSSWLFVPFVVREAFSLRYCVWQKKCKPLRR